MDLPPTEHDSDERYAEDERLIKGNMTIILIALTFFIFQLRRLFAAQQQYYQRHGHKTAA
jgi:hypothetical protein